MADVIAGRMVDHLGNELIPALRERLHETRRLRPDRRARGALRGCNAAILPVARTYRARWLRATDPASPVVPRGRPDAARPRTAWASAARVCRLSTGSDSPHPDEMVRTTSWLVVVTKRTGSNDSTRSDLHEIFTQIAHAFTLPAPRTHIVNESCGGRSSSSSRPIAIRPNVILPAASKRSIRRASCASDPRTSC